ncbi:MAG: MarR family transcriptional regulator [Halanaerobiales bacterium]|nr:MarR family transcriptional regulator [Halanaerobiales bacterium]
MASSKETKIIDKSIRDIHKNLVKYTKGSLRKHNLTMPRFLVLWYITKHQPVNMSFLHDKMHMASSTLTVIVDKLVDNELVKRYRNPEDRRIVLLELTAEGDKKLCEMLDIRQNFLERALVDLDDKEKEDLIRLLGTVLENLEKLLKEGEIDNE